MKTLTARTIASGVGFSEGPVICQNGDIVFVSIDQGRLYRIRDEKLSVIAELGEGPNGVTEGSDGTLYVAHCASRWWPNKTPDWSLMAGVQAVSPDGEVRWLSTDPIAPNDLCFGPDGLLYVTDPTRYHNPRDDGRLFRIDPKTGETELLCSVPWFPNGIGFSSEKDHFYVADSANENPRILRMPLDGIRSGKGEDFIRIKKGYVPDGFAFDTEGNLITSANSKIDAPGEVQVYDKNGKLLETFFPGPNKSYTNIALGADRTMYLSDSHGGNLLVVEDWPTAGMPLYPFRGASS